ncbi:hypothetical protein D3C77_722520 [compost metagenome]
MRKQQLTQQLFIARLVKYVHIRLNNEILDAMTLDDIDKCIRPAICQQVKLQIATNVGNLAASLAN